MASKRLETLDGSPDASEELSKQLFRFETAALEHTEATVNPNHRKANRNHDIIMKSVTYLKDHGELLQLRQFLIHPSDGVKTWAASFLLFTDLKNEALSILKEIAQGSGFVASGAEMILREWAKGNLKP